MSRISYSAVVLDVASHNEILKHCYVYDGWQIFAHHCTICLNSLPEDWKSRIGEEVSLVCTQWGKDSEAKAMAIKVDNFKRILPGTPHITVAVNTEHGGKPKDSNLITEWHDMPFTLNLRGTIQEIGS